MPTRTSRTTKRRTTRATRKPAAGRRPRAAQSVARPAVVPVAPGGAIVDEERVWREKQLALWAGVVFFMALIAAVWLFTIKQQIVALVPPPEAGADWNALFAELQTGLEQTKASVEEARAAAASVTVPAEQSEPGEVLGEQAAEDEAAYIQRRIAAEQVLYGMYERLAEER